MENKENNYLNFLERLQGKAVLIKTNSELLYKTDSLEVDPNGEKIFFLDKYGNEVLLAFSEVKQITEVKHGH